MPQAFWSTKNLDFNRIADFAPLDPAHRCTALPYAALAFAFWIACHTRSGVAGMSI